MSKLKLIINKDGMMLKPDSFPPNAISNGFSMFFSKSKPKGKKFNRLFVYNFNKYRIMNIHDPLITGAEFDSAYNPFKFNTDYLNDDDNIYFCNHELGCSYAQLINDNKLDLKHHEYIFDGDIYCENGLYTYYREFDYKNLDNLLMDTYPWPPKWPHKELDNIVYLFRSHAKDESMEYVFNLSKPNKIVTYNYK